MGLLYHSEIFLNKKKFIGIIIYISRRLSQATRLKTKVTLFIPDSSISSKLFLEIQ
jgi:hypothetical protein